MSTIDHSSYVTAEWELFLDNPARSDASRAATSGIQISRVLDVGCGAGQELLPFVREENVFGVGIDIAPQSEQVGRDRFASHGCAGSVAFMRADAASLPFHSRVFDVVICRIALPYMDNRDAIGEIARVLRHGGIFILKIHHARFYLHDLVRALKSLKVLEAIHASRVLVAGTIYHVFGKQPRNRLLGNESFQTGWMLRRELKANLLDIVGEMPDSNPATPSFIISNGRMPQV